MSLQDDHKNSEDLTSNGVKRRLFVSDFHDTLADVGGVRREYFKALVMMHLAGHDVVIASGLYDSARLELENSPVVQEVLDDLQLSAEEKASVQDGLLSVQDKSGLLKHLKARGLKVYPDVFCDDDTPGLIAKCHLDPYGEEFDGFCLLACIDPDLALETLLTNSAALRVENEAGIMALIDNSRDLD